MRSCPAIRPGIRSSRSERPRSTRKRGIAIATCRGVRFVIFLVGLVVGVAGSVAYGVFVPSGPVPEVQPLPAHAPLTVTLDESVLTALMQRAIAATPPTN